MIQTQQTINCRGVLLDLSAPKVMGVLNLTKDSFYDGSRYLHKEKIQLQVQKMIEDDVDIIDVGAMSSRPGATPASESLELERIVKSIEWILEVAPQAIISVDTYRSEVAKSAFAQGAHILNDISAFDEDPELLDTIVGKQIPYILMHMQGTPKTMQKKPTYQNVVNEVLEFFVEKISQLQALNIKDIIIDPGFGFGKSIEHNYRLLKNLEVFRITQKIIMVGLSRKSMIYKPLDIVPSQALEGTAALHMAALERGATLLRVHDVKAAKETIKLWELLNAGKYEE